MKLVSSPERELIVKYKIESRRRLAALRVFVDGVLSSEIRGRQLRAEGQTKLCLAPGSHWISAVAENDLGYWSPVEAGAVVVASNAGCGADRPRLFALMVGIDRYPNIPDANLSFAARDATSLGQAVEKLEAGSQYSEVEVEYLVNEEARKGDIFKRISRIAERARPQDVFLLSWLDMEWCRRVEAIAICS